MNFNELYKKIAEMDEAPDEPHTLRELVLAVLNDILPHAQAGENVVDKIADELGQYYVDVVNSGDHELEQVFRAIRELDTEDPADQTRVIEAAIEKLSSESSNSGINNEGRGDGNLANNAPPYDKVTRGDVIAGRLGKDEMGGKAKVEKEGLDENDEDVNECGSMMAGPPSSSSNQQDSVNMSVNMSGSGKGGIRDLLNIIKDIEGTNGSDDFRIGHGKMTIIDEPDILGDEMEEPEESFGNSPIGASGPHTYGAEVSTHGGNDLHKSNKLNYTAGNPEEIQVHLESLYQKIKGN